jgi:tRNA1(Val) A37 N6-methylase TrmN6
MAELSEVAHEARTDLLLDGQLRLRQLSDGHRAGTDAVLLAAAAPVDASGLVVDLGAGVGSAGLALALRAPAAQVQLVDNDPAVLALARANIELNGLASRVEAREADLFSVAGRRAAGLADGAADLVLTNPPFLDPGRARVSPKPSRASAHALHEDGALSAWIRVGLALLKPKGLFILIHRPEALGEILAACGKRAGALTLMPIHPRAGQPAVRILVRAKKGSRAPLSIAPPLILHEGDRFTAQAEAIHRGRALINW